MRGTRQPYYRPFNTLQSELGWFLSHQRLGLRRSKGFLDSWRTDKSSNTRKPSAKKVSLRVGEGDLSGTTLPALKDGFLCVISLLSTLRKPCVTASPLFSSAKTAAAPPAGAFPLADATGGGGGGGGGGGPPAAGVDLYCATETPCPKNAD
jgi:hypothetical protein